MLVSVRFLGVVLACLALNLKLAVAGEAANGITLDFKHGKSLTEEEIKVVSELAHDTGIWEIESVSTAPMSPSSDYMISVQEKPVEEGAFFKYRVLSIGSEKFFSLPRQQNSREWSKSHGGAMRDGFWTLSRREVKYYSSNSNGEEIRVAVAEGVAHEDVSLIISAIKNGRIEYSHDQLRKELSKYDWKLPGYVSLATAQVIPEFAPANFVLHCSNGGNTILFFILVKGDVLVINGYLPLIS
ncbi:hypothetical protein FKG94_16200 [Exilibacterium tricleocarpae]|uniref:Uncharacterized protein n=1 Tax=Exilibacterium tricleocarpae TaxID=2591008 RepID=A0A545TBF7_9GAMM|nr:hypothetical protein [Exilibacterium tricleocarpae]TQV74552.1 hypothetical protein FKG94_16200 [Exilibacterium tricleocarpae]